MANRPHDPFRMHDPHRRRGKNVEPWLLEQYRPLIVGLHDDGLTYDQIVEHFSNDEDAKKADFQPTRAQIKKWVPEWMKPPICNSHLPTTSATSPDLNALAPPHVVEASRKPSSPRPTRTQSDANIDPSLSPRNDAGRHKPGASVSFMLPSMSEQHPSHSTLTPDNDAIDDFMFPTSALSQVHPSHANGSVSGKLHEHLRSGNPQSKVIHSQGQDCFMTGAHYEGPWSATVDPPLMRAPSRASSMSLDQKSFLETHVRWKETNRMQNISPILVPMSELSVSAGRRSNGGGTYSIGSEMGARIAASTFTSMSFDSRDSIFHKEAALLFQDQDVRVPLRQVLGFSEVAAEFVKRRSSGLLECRTFASENPTIFYEDPGIFYQAAGLALRGDKKTLARHCFDCFNLVRAYHDLATRAFENLMFDLIAAEADGGDLTDHQRKINATFLGSGQTGLKKLKADVHAQKNWSLNGDIPSAVWQQLASPVCYDEFAKRWSMTPSRAKMDMAVDQHPSPSTPRVLSQSSTSNS